MKVLIELFAIWFFIGLMGAVNDHIGVQKKDLHVSDISTISVRALAGPCTWPKLCNADTVLLHADK